MDNMLNLIGREKLLFELELAKKKEEEKKLNLILQEERYEIEKDRFAEELKAKWAIRNEYDLSDIDPHIKSFEQWKREKGYE
jgi:hypothetical protein